MTVDAAADTDVVVAPAYVEGNNQSRTGTDKVCIAVTNGAGLLMNDSALPNAQPLTGRDITVPHGSTDSRRGPSGAPTCRVRYALPPSAIASESHQVGYELTAHSRSGA